MKKRLMLIAPMLHQGGFERVCVTTARLLEPYFEVFIVIFDSRDIAYDIKGLNVIDLHLGTKDNLAAKCLQVIKRSFRLRRLKEKLRVEIAYSFGPTANMVNILSRTREEIWVGIRSYMDMENPRKIRLFSSRADRVMCCSQTIEEEIRDKYGCDRAVTLYNPVDIEEIRRKACEESLKLPWDNPKEEKIVISMGREDEVKGFWHLLKSFSIVHASLPEARLMIIGDGEFAEYKELAKELGIADDVYFTGLKKNPFPYLACGELYVLTSSKEGFPNALVEAMALGLPVIATDCKTGPAEILEGGKSGMLVPNMDPVKNMDAGSISTEERELAARMLELLTHEEEKKRYREAAAARANDFSNEHYVKSILVQIQE